MTLTFELDLDSAEMNQRAEYVGQRSFTLKVTVHSHRHRSLSVLRCNDFALVLSQMRNSIIVSKLELQCTYRRLLLAMMTT